MILIHLLLKLFPAGWRDRYEEEFLAVLEQSGIHPIDYVNILVAAVDARLHPELHGETKAPDETRQANRGKTPKSASVYGPGFQAVGISSAIALRQLKVGDRLKKVNCIICKNDFSIPPWDYRYRELKFDRNKPCVCDNCSFSLRKEAMIISGIGPEDLERLDRMDKFIR
ncbi:MAG: hypothetical protein HPY50_21185 [Firmicutes bacterium]|nr:hypothetical protein [Bacillota bacterium]